MSRRLSTEEVEAVSRSPRVSMIRTMAEWTEEALCRLLDRALSTGPPFSFVFLVPVPSPRVTAAALSMNFLGRATSV